MIGSHAFRTALAFVMKWEGGYINHPRDPGGATKYGITRRTLARWRGETVSINAVKRLTKTEAAAIYHARYWSRISGDEAPGPIALVLFNIAVMSGPHRAIKILQTGLQANGAKIVRDGRFGPQTHTALQQIKGMRAVRQFATHLTRIYLRFLKRLRVWPTFGKGWTNRIRDLQRTIKHLPTTSRLTPRKRRKRAVRLDEDGAQYTTGPKTPQTTARPHGSEKDGTHPSATPLFDRLFGGARLAGKKTLIVLAAYIGLTVWKHMNNIADNDPLYLMASHILASLGGMSAMTKIDRLTAALRSHQRPQGPSDIR